MFRQAKYDEPLLSEIVDTHPKKPYFETATTSPADLLPPELLRINPPKIPDLSEARVVRHYTRLSQMTWGVDSGFYPLGSCTMKYNPRINETIAAMDGFSGIHPQQDESTTQGALWALHELQGLLCKITDMDAFTLQPAAGAHGEFTGLLLIKAYHDKRGDMERREVIVPDTAHGTNPASAAMAGFHVVEIPSGPDGCVDVGALKGALSEKTAALMLTNPNTLGIFEKDAAKIAEMVHEAGALLYYDGANLNAIMGKTSPGALGFDVVHLNLHKTFSTPHGGGGPGAGPVGVKAFLEPFLPAPRVCKSTDEEMHGKENAFYLCYDRPDTMGAVKPYHGNFLVCLRALAYIFSSGADGLTEATERAVLNSNYIAHKIKGFLPIPYGSVWKHEFAASGASLKEKGFTTVDLAKRMLDYGFHAPTIYFPHLVEDAFMVEPTETETKGEMDAFIEAVKKVLQEPADTLHGAPYNTSVGRVDETEAAKKMIFTWKEMGRLEE
ncbi:MAG: aminomethyl-transferring glycine dehydrogenase subunit GcvPB [Candidatus Thermoplasmatota archaeon]|nr:aminomethyl-transferring glycine dehydrogenase subunit GcvPB [Candidatus Thermoplasmatota archaeon]